MPEGRGASHPVGLEVKKKVFTSILKRSGPSLSHFEWV